MNKLFSKVAALSVGLAMAIGAGVAVGGKSSISVNAANVDVTFTVDVVHGNNTSASGADTMTYQDVTISTTSGGLNCTEYRFAKSSVTTVSSTKGNILKVVFTCTASGTTKYGPGCFAAQTGYSFSGNTGTWTGDAESVSFTASSNQVRASEIVVTYKGEETGNPEISLDPANLNFLTGQSAQVVTVTRNDVFTADPTLSVGDTPSYVNIAINGLQLSVTPKAIGSETITINAINGTQQASAQLSVSVKDSHGYIPEDPFTIAEAKALIDTDKTKTYNSVYVEGIISQIDSYNESYHSITYWISTDGTTDDQFEVYSGLGLNGNAFSAITDVEVGASVVVYGNIKYYSADSVYEFNYNNYLISYSAPSKTLTSISLSGEYKTEFEVGDTFDHEGLVVTANYSNESTADVTAQATFSGFDSSAATASQTITVSYTEGETTKTATYTVSIIAPTVKYTVSFDPGEGSGTMESVEVSDGSKYPLPTCTFAAPEGKEFKSWSVNDEERDPGYEITVNDDVEVVALWRNPLPYTSVDVVGVDGSYDATIIFGEDRYDGVKLGTSKVGGSASITVPAKTTNIRFHMAAWKDNTSTYVSLSATDVTITPASVNPIPNSGVSGNGPEYTMADATPADFLFEASFAELEDNTTIVFASANRFVIWGASYYGENVKDPELESISVSGQQTEYYVGDSFVKPTVTATLDSGAEFDCTDDAIFSGFDSSVAVESQTITVSYTYNEVQKQTSYTVSIIPVPAEYAQFKKVETNLNDFSGEYLFVYDQGSLAFDSRLSTLDAIGNTQAVTGDGEKINAPEDLAFTVAAIEAGYSVKSSSELFIGMDKDDNGLKSSSTDPYVNTINYDGENTNLISNGARLRYNSASNQTRFRYYKSASYTGQNAIAMYMKVSNAEALALDILNLTAPVCTDSDNVKGDFAEIWQTLETKYNALTETEQGELAAITADEDGLMAAEAMARYDYLCGKYGLTNFISGRTVKVLANGNIELSINAQDNNTMIIVIAIAATSVLSLGLLLVLKKKKHN